MGARVNRVATGADGPRGRPRHRGPGVRRHVARRPPARRRPRRRVRGSGSRRPSRAARGQPPRPRARAPGRHARQVSPPLPRSARVPVRRPGPRLLGAATTAPQVRDLQSRLRSSRGSSATSPTLRPTHDGGGEGLPGQARIPATGYVDRRTLDRLHEMTPDADGRRAGQPVPGRPRHGARLDPRCLTGRALCIDKTSSTCAGWWTARCRRTLAVRFGASYSPTREGLFHVDWKSRDHVSKLYDSAMPYAMFFCGGQAVHYSSDFAARGYYGASHGCVNVRDLRRMRGSSTRCASATRSSSTGPESDPRRHSRGPRVAHPS